jgi:hypothetical protein
MDYRHLRTVDYLIHNDKVTPQELVAFRDKMMCELAPSPRTLISRLRKGFTLLIKDPAFFWMKVRYQLGL